jgi:hypothetical protein
VVLDVYGWMMHEFDNGRQTSIEWEELGALVREKLHPPTPSS